MRIEQEKKNSRKITDFIDKTLLIVDDDAPLRDRLSRKMKKKKRIAAIKKITTKYSNRKFLVFFQNSSLTDEELKSFIDNQIYELRLTGCHKITDVSCCDTSNLD